MVEAIWLAVSPFNVFHLAVVLAGGVVADVVCRVVATRTKPVVYASDNGYLWGEHGLTDRRWAYGESIRISMLARLPVLGHPKGATSEAIVANIDLAPTLAELAGWNAPGHMQGKSFVSLLRDPGAPPTRAAH